MNKIEDKDDKLINELNYLENENYSSDEENDKKLLKDLNEDYEKHNKFTPQIDDKDSEKNDEELLLLSKEEIIQIKNYKILKLKSYINGLETDKQNLISDYKRSSDMLLERIKQLEEQLFGERPVTASIAKRIIKRRKENTQDENKSSIPPNRKLIDLNKVNKQIQPIQKIKNEIPKIEQNYEDIIEKNGIKINNFEEEDLENPKEKCPNCGEFIPYEEYFEHSLECIRKKYKCPKCNLLMDSSKKVEHIRDFLDKTKINDAIKTKNINFIKMSIEHGFNLNEVILNEENGNYLLHELAQNDIISCALECINEKVNINIINNNKDTPLIVAICNKNYKSSKELILNGANIKLRNKSDYSPLMLCCKFNLKDIAELLIKKGADVNEKNILGETPLKLAQLNHNENLALCLIKKYKANVGLK